MYKASERFYLNVITAYEQKLKQYMSEEEHNEFIKNTAKQCFLAEMLACPNKMPFLKNGMKLWEK